MVFSELGYSNADDVTTVKLADVAITFDKGTGGNAPKYYDSGTAVRAYSGNTLTFDAGSKKITGIKITFGASDGTNDITADKGSFAVDTWSGSESKVVLSIGGTSGNRRIAAIEVTLEGEGGGSTDQPEKPEVTSNKVVFSEQGYSNADDVTTVKLADVTITFDKGTGSNAPKYYDSGTAVRAYSGNTLTFDAGSKKITGIKITFGASDGTNAITADKGSFAVDTWSGSESKVVLSIGGTSGNRRIAAIEVTQE